MSKIISRIAKLQKLAENNENTNEAESAAKMALQLMRAHAISQADVDSSASRVEDPLVERVMVIDGLQFVDRKDRCYWEFTRCAPWKRSLGFAVAKYLGLQASYTPHSPVFTLYGYASDVTSAIKLYAVCARQIDRQCLDWLDEEKERVKEEWGDWGVGQAREAGRRYRNSAIRGLESKFAELSRESATEHVEGHALVITRAKQVADWVNARYTFRKGKGSELGNDVEFIHDGWQAGKLLRLVADNELEDHNTKALTGT